MNKKSILRGEIYYACLNPVVGSEQGDTRPVLVVQNDIGNKYSPTIVVAPITSNHKKSHLPTHVKIPLSTGLDVDSLALVEQIRTIDRSRLDGYIGRIDTKIQLQIDEALAVCVGLGNSHSSKGGLLSLCLCPRCERNFVESGCILVKKGWQAEKKLCDFCETKRGLVFGIVNGNLPHAS
jgi:mRNA interferase MazF